MSISPYFRTPFTDWAGAVVTHQWGSQCATLELKTLDCLEAYGLDKGLKVCEDLIADFRECSLHTKEFQRIKLMKNERLRQLKAGEKSKEDLYAPPPLMDSY